MRQIEKRAKWGVRPAPLLRERSRRTLLHRPLLILSLFFHTFCEVRVRRFTENSLRRGFSSGSVHTPELIINNCPEGPYTWARRTLELAGKKAKKKQ